MKTRILSIILTLLIIIPTLAACSQNVGGTVEVPPSPGVEYEYDRKFVSFNSHLQYESSTHEINGESVLAGRFTFKEGFLEQVNATIYNMGSITFSLYKWNKSYENTVSGEPIKSITYTKEALEMYVDAHLFNMELTFEEDEIKPGTYLYVISVPDGTNDNPAVYTGKVWTDKSLPEDYEPYRIVNYINGKQSSTVAVQSSFVFTSKVEKTEQELPFPTGKDPDGTAKVILIGGQSNAVGFSEVENLSGRVSKEKIAEYTNGYSNVKIMYTNTEGYESDGFVPVSIGQGHSEKHFGPELGLAEYLAMKFPQEKFYIIKYAKGGSILETQWYNAKAETPLTLLTGFEEYVNEGLELIKKDGLDPKIVGFIWNQGESDSTRHAWAAKYYNNLDGLVSYVRETFKPYASARGIAFIDAQIYGSVWSAYMNVNIQKVAYSKMSPINFCIDIFGYDIKPMGDSNDVAHYGVLSMLKLGNLYGAAIEKMLR